MKLIYQLFLICFTIAFSLLAISQEKRDDDFHDFGFERYDAIEVVKNNGVSLRFAWAGGLNACQFNEIDLNGDTEQDLVVFDRHGNRILPFLKEFDGTNYEYVYAPEYRINFPPVREWMRLVDYDKDGRNDIFTYTTGGIRVYRNISESEVEFILKEPIIYSFYFNGYVNLFALVDDYPVIDDIDGDGDMDILNFFTLGKYVNFHKNLSIEKYGHCDSLDFILEDECWGYFEENELNNILTLGIDCDFNVTQRKDRHAGSTLLTIDLDGNDVKDLLLGDVDFSTISGLINGGTKDSAYMISQDTSFPSYNIPISLMSMPVCSYIDVDNDLTKDLIVSPFDPGLDRSENKNSVIFYKNEGVNNFPYFEYVQSDFLQGDMIDCGAGAFPVVYDIDGDGLQDLILGNFGYLDTTYYEFGFLYLEYRSQLAYYRNTGNSEIPSFQMMDVDFAGVSELKIQSAYPAFYDLDGDDDPDMIVGNEDGTLLFYENIDNTGGLPVFDKPIFNYKSIDVGKNSTPQFIDLDRDGLIDLVIGEQSGNLNYYRNTGSVSSAEFILVTENLGGVDVTNINISLYGYSTPCFFEHQGEYRLFVGSEFGDIYYYKDIEDNLIGDFTLVDKQYLFINEGLRSGISIWNFNNDDYPDMLLGNYSGGVTSFIGSAPLPFGMANERPNSEVELLVYPNPVSANLDVEIISAGQEKSSYKYLEIYNSQGNKVNFFQIQQAGEQISIDVSNLPSGLYLLVLKNKDYVMVAEKFMVK